MRFVILLMAFNLMICGHSYAQNCLFFTKDSILHLWQQDTLNKDKTWGNLLTYLDTASFYGKSVQTVQQCLGSPHTWEKRLLRPNDSKQETDEKLVYYTNHPNKELKTVYNLIFYFRKNQCTKVVLTDEYFGVEW